jgi:DnaK suppressor protein
MPNQKPSKADHPSGLTPAQLEQLRAALVHARAESAALLKEEEATARSAEPLTEPMDAAELTREQGDAVLLADRARARLRDIVAALEKLETDPSRYGLSERSGEPIGFDRLKVVPWARLAIHEQ